MLIIFSFIILKHYLWEFKYLRILCYCIIINFIFCKISLHFELYTFIQY